MKKAFRRALIIHLRSVLKPFALLWRAAVNTVAHDGTEHAGYLAFLFLLAFFPFLVFLIAITGKMGRTDVGYRIISALLDNSVIPKDAANSLRPRVQEILSGPPQDLLTMAVVGAAWTSSTLVEGIRTVLNRAYGVSAPPPYVFRRLMSLGQFLLLSGLLVAVITLEVVAPNILSRLPGLHERWLEFAGAARGTGHAWWLQGQMMVTGGTLILIPAVLYAAVPNLKTRAMPVFPGALACALLWAFSGKVLSLYLASVDQVQLIYGSLGGVIASLFFFYMAALSLIYGAEYNYVLSGWRAARRKLACRKGVSALHVVSPLAALPAPANPVSSGGGEAARDEAGGPGSFRAEGGGGSGGVAAQTAAGFYGFVKLFAAEEGDAAAEGGGADGGGDGD